MIRAASAALVLAIAPLALGSGPRDGEWSAALRTPEGEIPFAIVLGGEGDGIKATIVNGPERFDVPIATLDEDGLLLLRFDHYDAELRARITGDGAALEGEYRRRRGADSWSVLPFHAEHAPDGAVLWPQVGRDVGERATPPTALEGRWRIDFEAGEDDAVGVFRITSPPMIDGRPVMHSVEGTILTTTGDYRYLHGVSDGWTARLATMDVAHTFLFTLVMRPSGVRGVFQSGAHHRDAFTMVRDDGAALPDAFSLTNAAEGASLDALAFPDPSGEVRSIGELRGDATIVELFGTWCPNCKDAADYLKELHARYEERGLSIVGLAFEITGDAGRDRAQAAAYIDRLDIPYPVLVAGDSDKAGAGERVPALDRVRAYPTAIFLDAEGRIRRVYTGFSGPATGEEHAALRRQWEGLIESLLDEAGR